jgi:RNA polymerase sigma factor (sigma-70 family)
MPDTRNQSQRRTSSRISRRVSGPLREPGRQLAEDLVAEHFDRLVAVARRYSLCEADAHDAFQRSVEILLRRAPGLQPDSAIGWMRTVVKHEAMAVRAERLKAVSREEPDHDLIESTRELVSSAESNDRLATAKEAISRLKPHEAEALLLRAAGLSYGEIQERKGWTYTKVNRLLTEGRAAFRSRVQDIESGTECGRWEGTLELIANGCAADSDLAAIRPHLTRCAPCRASLAEAGDRRRLTAFSPVGVFVALPALWHRLTSAWQQQISDPLLSGMIRAQGAVEAVSTGKVVAVAASAAAMAGGGLAVERAAPSHPASQPQRVVATPAENTRVAIEPTDQSLDASSVGSRETSGPGSPAPVPEPAPAKPSEFDALSAPGSDSAASAQAPTSSAQQQRPQPQAQPQAITSPPAMSKSSPAGGEFQP